MLARVDHKNHYYHSALGAVYQKMKRPVDAVTQYSVSLKLNTNDVSSHVNRGEIYLRHRKYKKAAQDFRSAILLDMRGKNLWANRARSLVIALKRTLDIRKKEGRVIGPAPRSQAKRKPPRAPAFRSAPSPRQRKR